MTHLICPAWVIFQARRYGTHLFKLLLSQLHEVVGAGAVGVRVLDVEVRERDVDPVAQRSENRPAAILSDQRINGSSTVRCNLGGYDGYAPLSCFCSTSVRPNWICGLLLCI